MKLTIPHQSTVPVLGLVGTVAGLMAIHLTLSSRVEASSLMATSILFWMAAGFLIWERRHQPDLRSGLFPSLLGISILALVLLRSAFFQDGLGFLLLYPFIAASGLALIASGWGGLKQYWRELVLLFFHGGHRILLEALPLNVSELTAQFAAYLLWYSGFETSRQGINITVANKGIEVYYGCSGLESVAHLLGLAVLFLVMFPTLAWGRKILTVFAAIAIGFVVNGIRVAIMATLVANSNMAAFEYWHQGSGSLLFSIFAALLFGGCCFLLQQDSAPDSNHAAF